MATVTLEHPNVNEASMKSIDPWDSWRVTIDDPEVGGCTIRSAIDGPFIIATLNDAGELAAFVNDKRVPSDALAEGWGTIERHFGV